MHVLIPQHVPDFLIRQRRLPLAHLPRDRRIRTRLLQKLLGRYGRGDRVVRGIKHLEPQSILLDTQITDLAEISGVNVAPGVAFAGFGHSYVAFEIRLILVRLDHVADDQSVDVDTESSGKGTRNTLACQFAAGVRVHWVAVVCVLVEREGVVLIITLREADSVSGFGAGNHHFLHAQFGGGFDDVVSAHHVASEGLAVRHDHIPGVGGEMDDSVRRSGMLGQCVLAHVEE